MPAVRPPIAGEIRATIGVAAPLAANLAQMAMQVTNAAMVGHLGVVPLAAAGLGNALNLTLLMTSMGLRTWRLIPLELISTTRPIGGSGGCGAYNPSGSATVSTKTSAWSASGLPWRAICCPKCLWITARRS
jgi:hypothetical protein